eukprot:TRINITY_DN108604_c0_g1_i1.p1 TRINITY_DN108604_c0_g1~~TRINITY_DN108604_c0_g1_i1.p1  ORF type:complete len:277 (+),score=24.94 TRINITY_DN108604_c0_g1_i1:44-832(+)
MAKRESGDWDCSWCGDHQFARNFICRQCGTPKEFDWKGGYSFMPGGDIWGAKGKKGAPSHLQGDSWGKGKGLSLMDKGKGVLGKPTAPGTEGVKEGDWICPFCGDHQFARNWACRQCGIPKSSVSMLAGDWICSRCGDHQFARNSKCKMCSAPKPRCQWCWQGKCWTHGEVKAGDWLCPGCGDHQFERNMLCRKCNTPKPADGIGVVINGSNAKLMPGDWVCPGCGDHQFQRNIICRKCKTEKPLGGAAVMRPQKSLASTQC